MPGPDTIGDLARQDLYPDERYMQPPVNPVDLPPEAYASLGGGDLGLLGKYGINVAKGLGSLAMIPGQAYQSTPDNPVTTEQLVKPATELALATVGTASPFAQKGALGAAGGKMAVPGDLAALGDYHPPFYSAVEKAVQDAKQNVAPGQQWAGYLRNQPGVKPEEVETLGLGKLFEQPGALSKDAVLGEIAANKVNVGEVVKSEQSQRAPATRVNEIDQQLHDIQNEFDSLHEIGGMGERRAALAAQERELQTERAGIVANWQDQASGRTKFSQYTLPGGENYREMLLTLPEAKPKAVTEFEKFKQQLELKHGTHLDSPYDVAKWAGSDTADQYEKLLRQAQDAQRQPGGMNFHSSHFDEPNVLAHVRYNDRVIDGKKTLFVEEVQSDWHQKGKREGYAGQSRDKQAIYNDIDAVRAEMKKREPNLDETSALSWGEAWRKHPDLAQQDAALHSEAAKGLSSVPDAPFKTTWPDLAMKRIIREAAEKGYDKVAWTPGSVQADRYDLSKQLKELQYRKGDEGTYSIAGITKNGEGFNHPERLTADELPGVVGKEMAEKIINGEGKRARGHPPNSGYFDGVDLKVGGEGMKGFYDEILPATVNRLVKKHGARVGQGNIERPIRSRLEEVQGMEPRAAAAAMRLNKHMPVHTLDITPSLRAAAMKGFPLFATGGVAATGAMGDLAKQDEYQ